jgi:glycosyltransferase involved in cell wall biosynthesis
MKTGVAGPAQRVGLLFTRFPVATETFLQREVKALRRLDPELRVLALWPASDPGASLHRPDHSFNPLSLLGLLWWIPYWLFLRPRAMTRIAGALQDMRVPNLTNLAETLLGLAYAVCRARAIQAEFKHLHAIWASAPATAAWALSQLTGIPYSMAGHAYDLFEDGGDGLLELKILQARFVRSSTLAGCRRLQALGALPERTHLVRRGLDDFPEVSAGKVPRPEYQLLAVGRLVEKMGYPAMLDLLARLSRAGLPFHATIIGGGPLLRGLERLRDGLGLAGRVDFTGHLAFDEVRRHYAAADLFLFTGRVARSGDRAGFPNAIAEAMASGVPVCASDVGAVSEGLRDGETGILLGLPDRDVQRICRLLQSTEQYQAVRAAARAWVVREFDLRRNMQALLRLLEGPGQ